MQHLADYLLAACQQEVCLRLPTHQAAAEAGLIVSPPLQKKKHHSKESTEGADLEAAEEGASSRHRKKKDKSKPDAAEGL